MLDRQPHERQRFAHQRVIFVTPPTGLFCREDRCQSYFRAELIPSIRPPMEECEAAGAISALGAEARVLDAATLQLSDLEVEAALRAFAPDLIVLVATFGSLDEDLGWVKRLREAFPDVAIGLRGAPCYELGEEILRKEPGLDFCARGDYELVFANVVREGFRKAAGVLLRRGDDIVLNRPVPVVSDLDSLPRPDRSSLSSEKYRVRWLGRPQATVRVQRGCPFPCSYCLVHSVSGSRPRHRSPESVAEEMAEVREQGTRYFYLRAETFSLEREWAREVSHAIARLCPDARWVTTTRVDCVDDETLQAMARGGCYGLSFGIDVASREIGERVGKRPDRERALRAMAGCDSAGIVSLGYFMLGFLWDTPATLAETAEFIHAVRPDLLTIHFAHPYPGTRYFDEVQRAHGQIHSLRAQAEPALQGATVDAAELEAMSRQLRRRHYRRPAVMANLARKGFGLIVGR